MTVTSVDKDLDALTMTVYAEFDAPIERTWQLWEDPRLLERWWGPPEYPATVVDHDLTPGGWVAYFMTGPDGAEPRGWWRVLAVDPPHLLEFEDGFADEHGNPDDDMPTMSVQVRFSDRPGGGTSVVIKTTFVSLDNMEQVIAMGAEEGMLAAMGQMDTLLLEARGEGSVRPG